MVLMFPVASHGPVAEFWVSGFAVLGLRFASRVVPPLSGVFERVVRIASFLQGGLNSFHGLGREKISLMVQDFLDVFTHRRCMANCFGAEPG